MSFGNEVLVAKRALEWSLTCMCPHVCLQVASLREFLEAAYKGTHQELHLVFRPLYFLNASQVEFFSLLQLSIFHFFLTLRTFLLVVFKVS
jgi:hypothetical protein